METGSRGRAQNPVVDTFQKTMMVVHKAVLRLSGGRVGSTIGANPVVVITAVGRTSGQLRDTPIFGYPDGDTWLVVASNGGTAHSPQWLQNLLVEPSCWITARGRRTAMSATVLSDEEKARAWPALVSHYKGFDRYQQKTDRNIPVVRFSPRPDGVG